MSAVDDLAAELKARYERPGGVGKVVALHLFGIERAAALASISLPALLLKAGLADSYKTELRKAMNLAAYVTIKR
ncbi:MAG: hypothetical protein V4659_02035 [Pseudomonadota bacterium]